MFLKKKYVLKEGFYLGEPQYEVYWSSRIFGDLFLTRFYDRDRAELYMSELVLPHGDVEIGSRSHSFPVIETREDYPGWVTWLCGWMPGGHKWRMAGTITSKKREFSLRWTCNRCGAYFDCIGNDGVQKEDIAA